MHLSKFNRKTRVSPSCRILRLNFACLPVCLRACVLVLPLAVWLGSQKALRALSSPAKRACCLLLPDFGRPTGSWRKKSHASERTVTNNNSSNTPSWATVIGGGVRHFISSDLDLPCFSQRGSLCLIVTHPTPPPPKRPPQHLFKSSQGLSFGAAGPLYGGVPPL